MFNMPDLILYIYIFIFGTIIGSFINVLIYRLPLQQNVVLPRSRCLHCQQIVKWYQNIPLWSYLFLRGKCNNCKVRISPLYPFIEFLSGLGALLLLPAYWSPMSLTLYVFHFSIFVVFLAIFVIDLQHQIIPNPLNLYLGILFLMFALFFYSWRHWLLGMCLGLAIPSLITWIYYLTKGKVGMGGGDLKLYAVLGILLGPIGVIQNIFLSCLLGSVIGVLFILLKRRDKNIPIPFGPFIVTTACLQIYLPDITQKLLSAIF